MMKKVLLLGDSIRMGYAGYVRELLKDTCEVIYDEYDNGRFAAYTLWQANQLFKKHGHFDVVHWNNGYWDMNVEYPMTQPIHLLGEYVHFLKRIIDEIIFATTTPILDTPEALAVTNYRDEWVQTYNTAAKALMKQEDVTVNDLYALMLEDSNYYKCGDMLHLTEEGSRKCAAQAARLIAEML